MNREFKFSCIKKLLLILLLVISTCSPVCADIPIDAAHFPDAGFRQYIWDHVYHQSDTGYDRITNSTLASPRIWLLSDMEWDLTGIEYFTGLIQLDCSYSKKALPDLSKNINLKTLYCGYKDLSELNLSANINLEWLNCINNSLNTLNISNNINLTGLLCNNNNISSLNVNNNKCFSNNLYFCFNHAINKNSPN